MYSSVFPIHVHFFGKQNMFNDSRSLQGPKTNRLKTKDVKALRRTLQAAFPECLGAGDEEDGGEALLEALVPAKAGVNKSQVRE